MRDRRDAQTLRNAPIPLSRNTGATARRTISATVVTERLGAASNMAALCTTDVGKFQSGHREQPEAHSVDDEQRDQDCDGDQRSPALQMPAAPCVESDSKHEHGDQQRDEGANRKSTNIYAHYPSPIPSAGPFAQLATSSSSSPL